MIEKLNQVEQTPKNSWVTKQKEESSFIEASLWEETKPKGDSVCAVNVPIYNSIIV
jgi:hypothetical protein